MKRSTFWSKGGATWEFFEVYLVRKTSCKVSFLKKVLKVSTLLKVKI